MKKVLIITVLFLSIITKINAEEQEWYQFTTQEDPSDLLKKKERTFLFVSKMDGTYEKIDIEQGSNNKYITEKITLLSKKGWILVFVTPYPTTQGSSTLFTRYLFKREKK